jgi:uncharacterized circularly permuted ATP-grasp superfamily protein
VHGLLKRLDDEFLDPLELRADSHLGVPGLLQAIRAGNVLVANAPGSAFLESTALLGFLPALSRHLLGEELKLPAIPTWWCGERAALAAVLPELAGGVIKPTFGGAGPAPCWAATCRAASWTNGPAASCATPRSTPCRPTCRCRRCRPGRGGRLDRRAR